VAGDVAEQVAGFRRRLISMDLQGSEDDWSSDACQVRYMGVDWIEAHLAEVECRAILTKRKAKLLKLAEALQVSGKLSKEQIKEIV
jgi:hypothetical protein